MSVPRCAVPRPAPAADHPPLSRLRPPSRPLRYPIDKLRKYEYGTSALDEESRLKRERGEKRECARGKYEVRKLPAA